MTNNQLKITCSECCLRKQTTPAQYYWNKGLFECHKWLCKSCYWEKQTELTIWELQEKQAVAKYLIASAKNPPKYLKAK